MSKPIYAFYCVQGFKEAWYQLSKEEQDKLFAKVGDAGKSVGTKSLIMCNSRWANEETLVWGVEEYPDIEAYQKHVEELEKLEWYRYISAKSTLGTKWEG